MKKALALSIFVAAASPAFAQQEDVAAFFKGKTLRLMVGIGVGSGYDINARLLARHMTAHIPGQAHHHRAEPAGRRQPDDDQRALQQRAVRRHGDRARRSTACRPRRCCSPAGARFDPNKLNWLGSTNRETQVTYVWHTAPVQSLDEVRTKEIVVGAQAPGSTQYDYPVLANHLFGFKFKVVTGYQSTPKINLAMESGEVHGTLANWSTLKALSSHWLTEKKVRMHRAVGAAASTPISPTSRWCSTWPRPRPTAQALLLALARLEYGRPFFLPPNVPAARVQALRRAFDATMKDPAYLAEADKLKIDVEPLTGEQVAALVEQVSRTPADTVARVRTAMENKYGC